MKEKLLNRINGIEDRFKKLKTVFTREKWDDVDDMFFSFEPLPKRGKEYWFLFFTSTEHKNGMQFLVMFGDQNVKEFRVDGITITRERFNEKKVRGVLSAWYYENGVNYLPTLPAIIEMGDGKVHSRGGNIEFSFSGKYPEYRMRMIEEGKDICDLKLMESKGGKKYDVSEYFKGGLGFGNVNLYLDFAGKLKGSTFKGRCYVQKVVITAPLPNVPWNWGRIYFQNGSLFEFLHPYVSLSKFKRKFATSAYFYDAKNKESHIFSKVNVMKFGSKKPHFLVRVESENKEMIFMLKPYATKKFEIDSIGKLSYDEHLVNVSSFSFEDSKKPVELKDFGDGVGLLEDGHGLVI